MESRISAKTRKSGANQSMTERIKRVAFVDKKLETSYQKLKDGKFEDKELHSFITRAINDLKKNPLAGVSIPKRLHPKEYVKKYGINNLYKYNLPNAWRLIYTILGNEVKIVSMILEWMNHKEYDRRFHYK